MDYKFTFEDGSEAYLEHHGVKGMKWGIRKKQDAITKTRIGMESEGGGAGGVDLEDDINKLDNDEYAKNDAIESFKDFSRFLKLSDGNVAEALQRMKAYNQGLKNIDAEASGMEDQSRGSKKAALGEAGINAEWSREQAVEYVKKQYEGENKGAAYENDMKLANSLPSAAERKNASIQEDHERKTVAEYKKEGAKAVKSDVKEIQREWSSDKPMQRITGVAKNTSKALKLAKKAGITSSDMKKENSAGKARVSRVVGTGTKAEAKKTGAATKIANTTRAKSAIASVSESFKKKNNDAGLATKASDVVKTASATVNTVKNMDASKSKQETELDKFLTKLRTTSR